MILTVLHVVTCIFLIIIILLQQGRGADMGASFGGGANTLFGASGADNLLTRITTATAFLFMLTSVLLTYRGQTAFLSDTELFKNYSPLTGSQGRNGVTLVEEQGSSSSQEGAPQTESSKSGSGEEKAMGSGVAAPVQVNEVSGAVSNGNPAAAPDRGESSSQVDGGGEVQAGPS